MTHTPVRLPRRLVVIIYDTLLLFAVLFFASLLVMLPLRITPEHSLYGLYVAYIYSVSFVFFGWFWTRSGQTLGMKTWKVRLQSTDGKQISWRHAALRFVAAIVSWLLLGGGFLWSLVDHKRRTLHDIVSGTELINVGVE